MRLPSRIAVSLALVGAATAAVPTAALAAGPVPPSRQAQTFTCDGQTMMIVTPPPTVHDSWSAAQIVGGGHFVPVSFEYLATDNTTGKVLSDELLSHGAAHNQQQTVECRIDAPVQRLGDLLPPGMPLPDGAATADDLVTMSFVVTAIAEP
ncbi:MAG: hypothetical protein ACTHNT_04965 [Actinomycetales bacterium]